MKAAFDPRPAHASATGPNAVGQVPLTRMAPVELHTIKHPNSRRSSMDPRGNLYEDKPENIPAEDKARLDGYLHARAEADEVKRLKEQFEALEAGK